MKDFSIYYKNENIAFSHQRRNAPNVSKFASHSHEFYELIYVIKGNLIYSVRGREYRVGDGSLIFSRPSEIHLVMPSEGHVYERMNILFDGRLLPFEPDMDFDVLTLKPSERVHELFERMHEYALLLDNSELGVGITGLAMQVFTELVLRDKENTAYSSVHVNDTVNRALDYIDAHLTSITSVDELSCALFITKTHLHRLFVKHLNISPGRYIITKRLSLARRMILRGGRPTAVFEECGFKDYSSFYRAYLREYGCPPSDKITFPPDITEHS